MPPPRNICFGVTHYALPRSVPKRTHCLGSNTNTQANPFTFSGHSGTCGVYLEGARPQNKTKHDLHSFPGVKMKIQTQCVGISVWAELLKFCFFLFLNICTVLGFRVPRGPRKTAFCYLCCIGFSIPPCFSLESGWGIGGRVALDFGIPPPCLGLENR